MPEAVRGATLAARGISIAFVRPGGERLPILDAIDWDLDPGAQVAVTGDAGAGKTTLLQAIAGFQALQAGIVRWDGRDPGGLEQHVREAWRRRTFGYVFEQFDLFPQLGVLANVLLPVTFGGWRASSEQRLRAQALLDRVGIRADARVSDLTRGERQRVAIVRALWSGPRAVLADEPTAGLDEKSTKVARMLLQQLCREAGATLIVATRDRKLAAEFDGLFELRAGRLLERAWVEE